MLRRRDFVLVSEPQSACRRRDSIGLAESPRKTMGVGTLTRHAGSKTLDREKEPSKTYKGSANDVRKPAMGGSNPLKTH